MMAIELEDVPEPVMAQFDRLPLAMRMRVAARVMDEVNARFRTENPQMGFSSNEPISASSMRGLAEDWERYDITQRNVIGSERTP